MPTLRELKPWFTRRLTSPMFLISEDGAKTPASEDSFELLRECPVNEADGLMFNCPNRECKRSIACLFAGMLAKPGMKFWVPTGTCLDDLTLTSTERVPCFCGNCRTTPAPIICPCGWRGHVSDGKVTDVLIIGFSRNPEPLLPKV